MLHGRFILHQRHGVWVILRKRSCTAEFWGYEPVDFWLHGYKLDLITWKSSTRVSYAREISILKALLKMME